MPSHTCYPQNDPDVIYQYCPSLEAAIAFSCLFGLVSIVHLMQGIIHKKPFTWVLIMGSCWECGGYIFRSLSVTAQKNVTLATAESVLILLAPLWINAFVYMLLGRMVQFFLDDRRVYNLKAKHFTWIFVSLDILSFIVQAFGATMASQQDAPDTAKNGLNVYMGGMGLQLLIILVFTSIAVGFHKKLKQQQQRNLEVGEGQSMTDFRSPHQARKLLYLVCAVLGLITLRIIFRLVEYSQGFESYLATHEWFPYVFDAALMLTALVALNILHPGRILKGPNSDFTEEKRADQQKKKEKKETKRKERERRYEG